MSSRQRFGFLLLPRFSLLSLGGALEALAAADETLGEVRHMAVTLSIDGAAVRSSTGTVLRVDHGIADTPPLDAVFVVAELPLPEPARDGHVAGLHPWLRARGAGGATPAASAPARWYWRRPGCSTATAPTLPAAHVAQLSAAHAAVVWSSNLYEIDRGRLTCAGAAASLDMLLAWLGQRHGERLAQTLVTQFGLERLRAGDERQAAPLAARIGAGSAKLAEALSLMEANLGEPLPTEDIAQLVGVSRRQLERLFKQHLDELPSRYYAELRLTRARRLLQQTSQSILQIGLACGFSSGSHFSNAYRARFARTPREERSQRAAAWRDNVGAAPAAAPPQEETTR